MMGDKLTVAPSMPNPSEGRIKVEPKLESPEGSKGREGVVTAEVKALVFVEVVEQVNTTSFSPAKYTYCGGSPSAFLAKPISIYSPKQANQ